MKSLIVGSKGQLGRGLQATAPDGAALTCVDVDELDITQPDAVQSRLRSERPDIVINAAAYTAVDRAEQEEGVALAINGTAVGTLAKAARDVGARFAHVSTDFVFDGTAGIPYAPAAATNPISAYGRTKLAGEQQAGDDALIVRTAWVYAPVGGNFVRTMLRLMSERPEIRVVADQVGTPTYAPALASAIWRLLENGARGLHHYTDSGACSWYDFAVAIQEEALLAGLLSQKVNIIPISADEYPTPARRPHYSVLDKRATFAAMGYVAPHWRENLRIMLGILASEGS